MARINAGKADLLTKITTNTKELMKTITIKKVPVTQQDNETLLKFTVYIDEKHHLTFETLKAAEDFVSIFEKSLDDSEVN